MQVVLNSGSKWGCLFIIKKKKKKLGPVYQLTTFATLATPLYLQELLQEYIPIRNLRSSSKLNLVSATVSTLLYGHRSFSKASTELWNNLPMHVKKL